MRLILSMLSWPDGAKPQLREIDDELVIGRGRDSGWMLPDPNNQLSRRHCQLTPFGEGWRIADLSLNGTFINDAAAPLGREHTHELHDGDQIRIGGYVIEARYQLPAALNTGALDTGALDTGALNTGAPERHWPAPPLPGPSVAWPPGDWPPAPPGDGGYPGGPQHGAGGEWDGPVRPDHVPATSTAWQPPPPGRVELPADWDQEPAMPASGMVLPADWDQETSVPPPHPVTPPAPPPPPPAVAPPVVATPVVAPPAAGPATDAATETALLAAFLRGTGLRDLGGADPVATMERVGSLLRVVVDRLRAVQIGRAAVKREFRILETMVRPEANNPIKFSADTEAALRALLTARLPAEQLVGEVLDDVRLHELAMIAAMRDAVGELVEALSPARSRAAAGELGLLPVQRKARAFDHYEALHQRTAQALADNFDSVFGKAFARAYERVALDAADAPASLGTANQRAATDAANHPGGTRS